MLNIVDTLFAPFRWGTRGTKRLAQDDNVAATTTKKRHKPNQLSPIDTQAARDIGKANLEPPPNTTVVELAHKSFGDTYPDCEMSVDTFRVMLVTMVKQLNLMDENSRLRTVITEDDLDMLLYLATKYHRYMAGSIQKTAASDNSWPPCTHLQFQKSHAWEEFLKTRHKHVLTFDLVERLFGELQDIQMKLDQFVASLGNDNDEVE
jgi:hypothetical protein